MNANEWHDGGEFNEVNGLKIFFRQSGEVETLLCIHGFPSSSRDFEKMWTPLSSHFNAIAPDLIGLGKSATSFKFKPRRGYGQDERLLLSDPHSS